MLRNKNGIVCDYCSTKYFNQTEMVAHHFFHVDQDIEALISSLNELDGSYYLPTACKARPNRLSHRVVEMDVENSAKGSSKPRRMSDRIDEVISLSKKYPLEKSFCEIQESSDNESIFEYGKPITPDAKTSVSGSSDNLQIHQMESSPQIKIGNAAFDKDSTAKSHSFKHHSPPTQGSVFCGVKNPGSAEATASDHPYSKLTVNTVPISVINDNSTFMRLVENAVVEKDPLSYKLAPTDALMSSGLANESKCQKSVSAADADLSSSFTRGVTGSGSLTCNDLDSATAYSYNLNGVYDPESSISSLIDDFIGVDFSNTYYCELN